MFKSDDNGREVGMVSLFRGCRGFDLYRITFYNSITPSRIGSAITDEGFKVSPLTIASHSSRHSLLTESGFVSSQLQAISKTRDKYLLLRHLHWLRQKTGHQYCSVLLWTHLSRNVDFADSARPMQQLIDFRCVHDCTVSILDLQYVQHKHVCRAPRSICQPIQGISHCL